MNESLRTFTQPEHIHVLLNHLPLIGLAVAVVVALLALFLRNRAALVIGLALTALLSASAWLVIESGEDAYDRVRPLADDAGRHALRQHMDLAEDWGKLYYATSAVALLALIAAWKKPRWLWPPAILAILLAMVSLIVGALIAEAGGRIRHPEFRPVELPVQEGNPPDSP
jgi:uncharacterized membrane protein